MMKTLVLTGKKFRLTQVATVVTFGISDRIFFGSSVVFSVILRGCLLLDSNWEILFTWQELDGGEVRRIAAGAMDWPRAPPSRRGFVPKVFGLYSGSSCNPIIWSPSCSSEVYSIMSISEFFNSRPALTGCYLFIFQDPLLPVTVISISLPPSLFKISPFPNKESFLSCA